MAVANITVPVDELEIIELPGIITFRNFARANTDESLLQVNMTFRTPASKLEFTRRVNICNIVMLPSYRQYIAGGLSRDRRLNVNSVRFDCELNGQWFVGTYDYTSHTGTLKPEQSNR